MKIKLNRAKKDRDEFINCLLKLQPIEVIALTKILCVKVIEDKKIEDPKNLPTRDVFEIFEEMILKFEQLKQKTRTEILEILRPVAKYNTEAHLSATQQK